MQMFSLKTAFSSSQTSPTTFPTLTPKLLIVSCSLFLVHFPRRHEGISLSLQKFKWLSLHCHHKYRYPISSRSIEAKYFCWPLKYTGKVKTEMHRQGKIVEQVSESPQLIPGHQCKQWQACLGMYHTLGRARPGRACILQIKVQGN